MDSIAEKTKNTFIVNFWDVDGCMMTHQFPNGKMNDDLTKDPPFPWVYRLMQEGDVNLLVSGRGSELAEITMRWFDKHFDLPASYIGVDWQHQSKHDQRMDDYVERKALKLLGLALSWDVTLRQSNMLAMINIYEDDAKVLLRLATYKEVHRCPATCWIVVDGRKPVKYEVKA